MRFFHLTDVWGSRCEAHDHYRRTYPKLGVESIRCGGYATTGVVWQGRIEGEHTLNACNDHAREHFASRAIDGRAYEDR